jgi:hypothetical protein
VPGDAEESGRQQYQQKHAGQPGKTDANPLHSTLSLRRRRSLATFAINSN